MLVKLKDVVDRIGGNIDRFNTDLIYYLGGEHYDSESIGIYKKGLLDSEAGRKLGFKFHFPFQAGDTIFMSRNPHLKKAGMIFYDGLCSDTSYILRTKDEKVLLHTYLPLVLQTDKFWNFFEENKSGSVNFLLNWKEMQEFEFELPDIRTQRSVADAAWAIEETRLAYEDLLQKTDELVQSRFVEMFGDPDSSSDVVPFETAFIIRDDLRKPINDVVRSQMRTGTLYPYYGANGQVDSINEYLMDCEAICLAEDCGAYGAGESTSYIVTGKCWVNNHAHVLIPKPNCDIEYANVYFRILDMKRYVDGTTRLKLTQEKMKKIPVVLPNLVRQKQFAAFVGQADKSKTILRQALDALNKTYKRIIAENLG